MLFVMLNGEVVNQQVLFTIDNIRGLHVPYGVVDQHFRGVDTHVCRSLPLVGLEELRGTVECSLDGVGLVIVPVQTGDELVIRSVGIEVDVQSLTVVHQFAQMTAHEELVHIRCVQTHDAVFIAPAVVGESR